MPTPRKNETKSQFMGRCVPFVKDDGTAKSNDQAVAICLSLWAKKEKKSQEAEGMKNNVERRAFAIEEIRVVPDSRAIVGHAAVFNRTTDMGWFIEEVAPGFFAKALLNSDVRMLFNHDPNYVLGRTKSGTLRLREDLQGLHVDNDLPNTQFANDLAISMQRGDINQMSFAWVTKTDKWEKLDDGRMKRTLIEAEEIFDTSVVTYPAYEDTDASIAKRSFEMWEQREAGIARADDENRGAISFSSHGDLPKVSESDGWDAGDAKQRIAKWASSDGSGDADKMNWSKYREGFAWYNSEKPEDFGSYKLPHHDVRGGQLEHHWRGSAAAMGALLGARGGVKIPSGDKEAVYNHLRSEYNRYGKKPPDYRSVMDMPEEARTSLAESFMVESEAKDPAIIAAEAAAAAQAETEARAAQEAAAKAEADAKAQADAIALAQAEGEYRERQLRLGSLC